MRMTESHSDEKSKVGIHDLEKTYSQTWNAFYNADETHPTESQADGKFKFIKDEEMKLAKVSDTKWRIEDTDNQGTNEDEYIELTLTSNNTLIETEWHGIATPTDLDGDTYYYIIKASFRKR